MRHPNRTGLVRRDGRFVAESEPFHLREMEVVYREASVSRFLFTSALSDDPLITFRVRAGQGGVLRALLGQHAGPALRGPGASRGILTRMTPGTPRRRRRALRNDELIDARLIRGWLLWGFFWLMFAPTIGVLISTKFNYPEFLGTSAWSTFGRLRPVHVNGVIFGRLLHPVHRASPTTSPRAWPACACGTGTGATRSSGSGT